jgi:hypothetical protein
MAKSLIKFENNHSGFYYSGQVVSGIVEVTLKKPMACRGDKEKKFSSEIIKFLSITGLLLTISGKADFKWKNDKKETSKATEVYLKNKIFVFGNEDSDPIEIDVGCHSYSFSTVLPLEIPSSFAIENIGKISYKAEAVFILPWKMYCMKAKAYFRVVSHVDLNNDPTLNLAFNSEITTKIKKFFTGYRTLHMKVFTPTTGFLPGHKMKLFFDVNNRTKTNVSKIVIRLVQVLKLISEGNTKTKKTTLIETFTAGIHKKSDQNFESDITIPTSVTPMKHSNVMTLTYQIEIVAKLSSNSKKNPKFVIPIEIGTVAMANERISRSGFSLAQNISFISKYF